MASAPFHNLENVVRELESAGADYLHFDIEDGSFVPEMRLGIRIISELRPLSKLPFDVHLMMRNPEWLIPHMADIGVDWLSVHYEACPYPRRTLRLIHEHAMQAGLAFNPTTTLPALAFCRPYLRFVLILTTDPENQDPAYLPSILTKVSEGRKQPNLEEVAWAVDGGFTAENISDAMRVGADIVVAGRGVFEGGQIRQNILNMKNAAG